jgi:hypothetical protein
MSPRKVLIPVLAALLLVTATTQPAQAQDPFTAAIQKWQKQFAKQWQDAVKRMQAQIAAAMTKKGYDPTKPYVSQGFTVEVPAGPLGAQVGGLGVNQTGTAVAVAVGSPLGITGDLYLVDTLKQLPTKLTQGVTLPFDGTDALSLDGHRVVFTSGVGPLSRPYSYATNPGTYVQLSSKQGSQPSISANGKFYAVMTDGGLLGKDTVIVGDPLKGITGTPITTETAASSSVVFGRPQISGDGHFVGYLVTTGSKVEFHEYDTKLGVLTKVDLSTKGLPAGGTNVLTDWSWDLRRLLVSRTVGSIRTLYIVDLLGTSRVATTLPAAVGGESSPTFRADGTTVAVATPNPTDASDTNGTTDLAWVNPGWLNPQRQSFGVDGKQLVKGIGLTSLGQRIPRFAVADSGTAAFWVNPASTGGGESVYVRTTLPVPNPPAATATQ